MREKIERCRSLAGGHGTNTGSAAKCKETSQGSTRSKGKNNQRHFHSKDQDIVRGRKAKREWSSEPRVCSFGHRAGSFNHDHSQVHFEPDGVAAQSRGPEAVEAAARDLTAALDALGAQTGTQAQQLAAALAQVDAYCVDVSRLRAQLLEAEQQLRQAAQPNYSPRDPERAQRQQQVGTKIGHGAAGA